MKWYNYLFAFLAGLFLSNTIPHLVSGICGNAFPTPFANPPGKGLSSPTINVLWALLNLVIGYLLINGSKLLKQQGTTKWITLLVFFIGFAAMAIMLSIGFADKMSS